MRSGVIIALIILSATGYGLYYFFSQPRQPFTAPLMRVDTAAVTSIVLTPPLGADEITLLRENEGWIASNGQIHSKALTDKVHDLLQMLVRVEAQEVVTTNWKYWKVYGVDRGHGIRVRVYTGKKLIEDFVVGKSDADPRSQLPISYLRLQRGAEVYTVLGRFLTYFEQNFGNFRNALVLEIEPNTQITVLEWQLSDTTWHWQPTPQGWSAGATLLDSAAMTMYLAQLRRISGEHFANDFDEVQGSKYLHQTLTIHFKNETVPFVITSYRDTTRNPTFVIHSSQNPEAFFASDSLGIYNVIYNPINEFLKNKKEKLPQ